MANLSNINNKFLVTTGGNVLIGQTAVVGTSILQVEGSTNTIIRMNSTAGTGGRMDFAYGGSNYGNIGSGKNILGTGNAADMMINADSLLILGVGSQDMTILPSGNVGIGTASPASSYGFSKTLEIQGAADAEINISQSNNSKHWSLGIVNGANYQQTTSGQQYIWLIGGSEKMRISNTGNVGIGENSPTNGKLQIKTSSAVAFSPTVFTSGANLRLQTGGTAAAGITTGISMGVGGSAEAYIGAVQNVSTYADIVFQTYHGAYGERMRINSIGNVGIGIASPAAKLDVLQETRISYLQGNQYRTRITNTDGNTRILSDGAQCNMIFGTTAAVTGGTASEKMRIDWQGNVGIGTTSPQDKLEIKSGYIRLFDPSSSANAGYPIRWTSNSGGTNVSFAEISGVTTSAGNRTGDIYFSTSNSGAPTEKMRITSGGNVNFTGNTSANVVVSRDNMFVDAGQLYIGAGNSSVDNTFRQAVTSGAFKIESRESGTWTQRLMIDTVGDLTIPGNIFASSIFLGGTATANKLNDYEEGTWTPSITAAGGNAATATYHNPVYTKVGRIVNVVVYIHTINIASITSGTYVLITGFPFTAENYGDFTASYHYGGWSGGVIVGGYVQDGQNYAYLMRADGVEAQQQTTDLVMTRFMLNVTYQTT